MLHSDFGTGSI